MASVFPGALDDIPPFQDITPEDAPKVKMFQEAIQSGDFATASRVFQEIPNANSKFMGASRLNPIRDGLLAVEKFYGTDVKPYIEAKQVEWEQKIDNFIYLGIFDPNKSYIKNNIVAYNDGINSAMYLCTSPTATIPTPEEPAPRGPWILLTKKGDQGISGGEGAFMFEWNNVQQYAVYDIVVYGDAWYIAMEPNTNINPSADLDVWNVLMNTPQTQIPVVSLAQKPVGQQIGDLWFRYR